MKAKCFLRKNPFRSKKKYTSSLGQYKIKPTCKEYDEILIKRVCINTVDTEFLSIN